MQLSQSASMRLEQRQLLTPRMIQSMEILQLPVMALEERIEQELESNPVLELRQGPEDATNESPDREDANPDYSESEQALVVKESDASRAEDFSRLERIADYLENEEFATNDSFRLRSGAQFHDGERDAKLDALASAPGRATTLHEHLMSQWALAETNETVRAAGRLIIDRIDDRGYLTDELETIRSSATVELPLSAFEEALKLIHQLDPAGVGARDFVECLLLQLDALERDPELSGGHDFALERSLIRDHRKDLENNRLPQIAKRLGSSIDDVKNAVKRLSRLHPHPGKLFGRDEAPPVTPDAIVYFDESTGQYGIQMAYDPSDSLRISGTWRRYIKQKRGDKTTREFLMNNVRNARWLIDAIKQRSTTIKRVIRAVVDAQRDFFDKGPEYLKPLPMVLVADQLGIHVATVSRAVSDKWIQTPRGVFPLRRFFSGGTTSSEGEDMSWDAVKEKLRSIIDAEDKRKPLNDDEIVAKLSEQGIKLARRTVAKYRDIMGIPTARQRREF